MKTADGPDFTVERKLAKYRDAIVSTWVYC